ncbi:MAG: DinB family protein [Acidimicrobiales bacterium]
MADIGASLLSAFDSCWERFATRLNGLDDAEYLWEPVEGCWSLRRDAEGWWRLDGLGIWPEPDPAPITTIAWRVGHIAGLALGGFTDRLFGDGNLTPADVRFPGRASDVPAFCEENYRAWRVGMESIDDARWHEPLGPAWAPYENSNTADLALHVLDELTHHGAEVALLRDLYVRRDELSGD